MKALPPVNHPSNILPTQCGKQDIDDDDDDNKTIDNRFNPVRFFPVPSVFQFSPLGKGFPGGLAFTFAVEAIGELPFRTPSKSTFEGAAENRRTGLTGFS